MKKFFITGIVTLLSMSAGAYDDGGFSFNITGYTTNYYAAVLYNMVVAPIQASAIENEDEIFTYLIPRVDVMFPIAVNNTTQETVGKMYTPYRRCLKAPWKDMGDYSIGVSAAYDMGYTPFGIYIGCSFKSTKVPTKLLDHRTSYISTSAGIRLRYSNGLLLEVGGAYDSSLSYKGNFNNDRKCVNGGFCANFGIGVWGSGGSVLLKYEHPLYNYFNENYSPDGGLTHPFEGVKRRMGYIHLAIRYGF